jgi:hypothetical protein
MNKLAVAILIAFTSLNSWANISIKDSKIGPVVAIKREVSSVYDNCLAHMVGDTDKPMFAFSCRIEFQWDPATEVVMSSNPVLRHSEETCMVEANFSKERMVLVFGNPKAPLTLDEAKLCLDKGTKAFGNKFNLMIFKAEVGP